MKRTEIIFQLGCEIASLTENFQGVRGSGEGNHATNKFMTKLRSQVIEKLGNDYSEKHVCGNNSFAVDFYIPEEKAIIEVALGLPNSASEFEKDILKAIMTQEQGIKIERLIFISRAGAQKKCCQPGRMAIRQWAKEKHKLAIDIFELPGDRRHRKRLAKNK